MNLIDPNNQIYSVMHDLLGEKYVRWEIVSYSVTESKDCPDTHLKVALVQQNTGKQLDLAGKGEGVIDAFFNVMLENYSKEYRSLETINFSDFKVVTDIGSKNSFSGADAEVEVLVSIENSYQKTFDFVQNGRSMMMAAMHATLSAIEFFVNSELAYVSAYQALQDSKQRHRSDLSEYYGRILIQLVHNTSYSELIESIKKG